MFVQQNGAWHQEAYLKADNANAGDQFGDSVALYGDTIAVGASAVDPYGDGFHSGAAYVFVRSGGQWIQQAFIRASTLTSGFGRSVALSGRHARRGRVSVKP